MPTPQELESSNERLGVGRYKEQFLNVVDTVTTLADIVASRLGLEDAGISVQNVPVGGINAFRQVQNFWVEAREGFKLCFRVGKNSTGINLQRLISATTTPRDVIEAMERLGIKAREQGLLSSDSSPFLPAFATLWATLVVLHGKKEASLRQLESRYAIGLSRHFAELPTHWTRELTAEYMWYRTRDLAAGVRRAVWRRGSLKPISDRPVMEAMHFSAVAEELTQNTFGVWS